VKWLFCVSQLERSITYARDTAKPGLWTLDWTVDRTLDSITDSISGQEFQSPRVKSHVRIKVLHSMGCSVYTCLHRTVNNPPGSINTFIRECGSVLCLGNGNFEFTIVMYHSDNGQRSYKPQTKHAERMILPGNSQKYLQTYF